MKMLNGENQKDIDYQKNIILDADGVLMNLHEVLEMTLCETYPSFSINNIKSYDFNKMLKNNSHMVKELYGIDFFEKFNKDENLMLGVPRQEILRLLGDRKIYDQSTPYPNVIECLESLAEKGVLFTIHSQGMTKEVCDSKLEFLYHYFGRIPNINIQISLGNNKPVLIGDAIVEDNPLAIVNYYNVYKNFKRNIKIEKYLIDMPYNQGNVYQFLLATEKETTSKNYFPIDAIATRVPNLISALKDIFPTMDFSNFEGINYIYKNAFNKKISN